MALVLDSSVVIEAERRRIRVADLPIGHNEPLYISAITISEVLYGSHSARTDDQRAHRQDFFDQLLDTVLVLPFDQEVAAVYSKIWFDLRSAGLIIGIHDMIIAATALTHSHIVVTDNVREFLRVSGLQVLQPAW